MGSHWYQYQNARPISKEEQARRERWRAHSHSVEGRRERIARKEQIVASAKARLARFDEMQRTRGDRSPYYRECILNNIRMYEEWLRWEKKELAEAEKKPKE